MPNTLWMRWLDFRRLRDLFWIVADHDCQLRAKDLNELAIRTGVLVNEKGEPFKPTPIYHYRRTLERLGLVRIHQHRFCVVRDDRSVEALLAGTRRGPLLSATEKRALATLVVRNQDCYEAFFKAFVPDHSRPCDIDEFISIASPVLILDANGLHGAAVILLNKESDFELAVVGHGADQAISWGLKPWCVEQLTFIDEIFPIGLGHTLYSRYIEDLDPQFVAVKLMKLLEFKDEWAMARVDDLILQAGQRWHVSADSVKDALLWLRKRFPGHLATIATSEQFILGPVHSAQRKAVLNSYLRLPNGERISHLRVHSDVAKALRQEEVARDN